MPAYESLEPRGEAVLFEDLGLQIEKDALVEFSQNIVEQFALVAEIAIDQTVRNLSRAGDVRNRCSLEPFFGKGTLRCIQNRVVTILHSLRADRWHLLLRNTSDRRLSCMTTALRKIALASRAILNIIHFGLSTAETR